MRSKIKCGLVALAVSASSAALESMAAPSLDELWETIKKQEKEIAKLKKEQAEANEKIDITVDAIDAGVSSSTGKQSEWASKTAIGGYGEHHLNVKQGKDDQIDAHRFVIYVAHQFDKNVRFFSEFELEHGLAGEGKPGEVELEQAFIEWDYAANHSLVAGQFLVPVGILNEIHEPDTFYGTERNLIEKNIIPTTWWETGVSLNGQFAPGLSYNLAVHSGLKNADGKAFNIRSARQKSAKANANDLAYTGRVKYTAVPGLELAATLHHQTDLSQGVLDDASGTLVEAHAIYTVDNFSLRALAAQWDISGSEAELVGRDDQSGFFIEPSYKITPKLGVFVRYSEWDNTAGLSGSESDEVVDYGVNFWLHPRVVFKADVSDFQTGKDNDSVNLGVGWSY